MKITMNKGTEFETEFDLVELSEGESWSLSGPEGSDAEELDWPSDEECSRVAGVRLEMFDAGDHPTCPEAILHVVRD